MTITLEQLLAYEAYRGDIDGWSRSSLARSSPRSGDHWVLIDELVMRLRSEASGHASSSFSAELRETLARAAPDPAVQRKLRMLASQSITW